MFLDINIRSRLLSLTKISTLPRKNCYFCEYTVRNHHKYLPNPGYYALSLNLSGTRSLLGWLYQWWKPERFSFTILCTSLNVIGIKITFTDLS